MTTQQAKPYKMRIYGVIGLDITAQTFVEELAALDGTEAVQVHINSPGGNVFEGVAITNALRGYEGKVTVIVDGIAASAASFIAMAGDELVMSQNAELMVHNSHSEVRGGSGEMRKLADNLDRINSSMAGMYAGKAGGSIEDWKAIMAAETWYSADEAVKAGLADRIETVSSRADKAIAASFDLSVFNHAGRQAAPPPQMPVVHQTPLPTVEAEAQKEKEPTVALNESSLETLGLDADADDEAINTAIAEKFGAKPEEPVAPTLEQATQVAAQFDSVVVNRETFANLQAQAQSGAEARAQQVREAHEREVDAAIGQGRIGPMSRESFLNYFAADTEGARRALANIAPNTIPLAEVGHGVSNEITNEDDALYASIFGTSAGKDA